MTDMQDPLALLRYSTIAPSHRERPIKQGRTDRTVAVDWTASEGGIVCVRGGNQSCVEVTNLCVYGLRNGVGGVGEEGRKVDRECITAGDYLKADEEESWQCQDLETGRKRYHTVKPTTRGLPLHGAGQLSRCDRSV